MTSVEIQSGVLAVAGNYGDFHGALSAASSPANLSVPGLVLALVAIGGALTWTLLVLRRRRFVRGASSALKYLEELNSRFRPLVQGLPPITYDFGVAVNSKSKFDRFDLAAHMARSILDYERWFEQEVLMRVNATQQYDSYHRDFEFLAFKWLGASSHPRVKSERFAIIEKKTFNRRKLAYPLPKAQVSSTVRYTSPKGKNSYSGRLIWNFDQLRHGLLMAQQARARISTAEALRQRERSLMTPGLRTKVLQRDNFQCRMCGHSARDGVTLHIDHITPVSHGGLTVLGNLQTLCATCNLGKGNRFVG